MSSASQAIVPVSMDVEMANGGATDSVLQAADADAGNDSGGIVVLGAVEASAGQQDDSNAKASDAVEEGENKKARKKIVARSDIFKNFQKVKVGGVLRKAKCNYCKTQIAAHPLFNCTSALHRHFHVCKCNPQKNKSDDNQVVM